MRNIHLFFVMFLILLINNCAFTKPHLQRGEEYLEEQKYDRAIVELEKAASEEGNIYYYIDTYSQLGDAYVDTGQINKALAIYRNALQIINLRMREITSLRSDIRRDLNFESGLEDQSVQEKEISLADELSELKERRRDMKRKIKKLLNEVNPK